ncbi:cbb3-type cytochrome c oxidase subunit 3 [Neptunomonas phycophila]|uniref:Cbb3-type cytochrome c oxidase subunit 3 n=2 Tax=Oceanospirillaceae TaxID=135620 RepID=A0AAW7XFT5_9GAMM|nr:cbb3-type cytochrome c oxidase subunit 3 [Neptunomonas phycophila]MBT3146232.1 cbb3-type cytochrome c oxidase subunit 3 [Neptunomonas phycophila]MDO6452134.1 cbb3-type cytochrome c oxidase subunit 3 [Neptunomonas phycophila]MDO6466687.1 cbb3-type cytochrome c oxidase subunit 3 [Neptunomonas phycophila]MDO6783099.1 cbb3-type cytochrome c oxidase subunit 3 [Neptunomonas phycophila]MDP2521104.1 cbb3-type cytochrome c oxidase subunit 3 [Neptunomonas phycophila]
MLLTFVGLFIWVLLPGNKKRFDEASQLPFADDKEEAATEEAMDPNRRVEK